MGIISLLTALIRAYAAKLELEVETWRFDKLEELHEKLEKTDSEIIELNNTRDPDCILRADRIMSGRRKRLLEQISSIRCELKP